MKIELKMDREFSEGLSFWIEVDEDIIPIVFGQDIDGGYPSPIVTLSPEILDYPAAVVRAAGKLLTEKEDAILNYHRIVNGSKMDITRVSQIQDVLDLELNSIERSSVLAEYRRVAYLYLLKDSRTDNIKIGTTRTPYVRLAAMRSLAALMHGGTKLRLLHVWRVVGDFKKRFHREYAEKRNFGEWFSLSNDDLGSIYLRLREHEAWPSGFSLADEAAQLRQARAKHRD